MNNFEDYNRFHTWRQRVSIHQSWVIGPTTGHDKIVAVFWNEQENRLGCFSTAWPHKGWQEYSENEFVSEHYPWDLPGREWLFIGAL